MNFPSVIITGTDSSLISKQTDQLFASLKNQNQPNNPDLIVIDQQSGYTIENIRKINHFFSQKPIKFNTKIVLIVDAQNLNLESQNALLKTLEEPPKDCYLILTCSHTHSLIPTIISRCHLIKTTPNSTKSDSPPLTPLSSIKDNLLLSEKYSLSSPETLIYLQDQLNIYHQLLTKNPNLSYFSFIKKILKAIDMVKSNVDPRSALDYLLLS
jgi:DNA polymerase III delta prime subunit